MSTSPDAALGAASAPDRVFERAGGESGTLAASRPALTPLVKSFYGLGAIATPLRAQLLGFLLLFYNQLVGLKPQLISFVLMIALLVDAIWDPLVGQISDNTHTRWGRRHPYIYGAALPAALCFALLFMPPHG